MKTKLLNNKGAVRTGLFTSAVTAGLINAAVAVVCSTTAYAANSPSQATNPQTAKQQSLIGGVDHVGLAVSNLENSKTFFTETLGFKVLGKDGDYPAYFLNNGAITVTLWQTTNGDKATPFNRKTNVGLHHLAFQVETLEKLNQLHDKLKATASVTIEFAPENLGRGPTQHMMIREPSGNRLEFITRVRR
ncbi:VOC family protein [Thalassotalea euphylliae]|uniref:VOC family protein n=1 Tax=Thalassotalea euphylliae TaxID=1655234 RepID=A0A3E0TQN4_9GAMM|nr:VOC family protein [Thalassotalea euphylliae]REL26265.1 VOC family protein [Thalassotalea euphylliae]